MTGGGEKGAGQTVFLSRSERETFLLAKQLAEGFEGKEIVLLSGELGAGKTVFAKGLASGLGIEDPTQVCSPSYTLVNVYKGRFTVFHIDLYRLEKDDEIVNLGWEDYLGEGVVIVEWAEKLPFPLQSIRVSIAVGGNDERTITLRR